MRRHRIALVAAAALNFVFFFPVAFMGRVVSPNDVFFNSSPWMDSRPAYTHPQNSLLNDPPTAYYTLMTMARRDWRTFDWNPYVACGIPGFGSSAAALLSPFVFIPLFTLPLPWVFTAMIFLKLNVAFLFAYLWLREERLGERGAAIGAIVIAAAGVYSVRWLWQITNATPLYPALLWIVRRAFNHKPNSIALVALLLLSFGLAGFPAAIAYGAYAAALYAVVLAIRGRQIPLRGVTTGLAAAVLALLIALPSIVPFVQLLRRSGYLELRESTSLQRVFPASQWLSFVFPDRLGNPARKNWVGDSRLGAFDNYIEATVYIGLITIPLVLLGIFAKRARARWYWLAFGGVVLACMFGAPGVLQTIGRVPGFKYSSLTRLVLLLPLAAGYLAGAGGAQIDAWLRRWPFVSEILLSAVAIALAFDLGLFAGRFHPYLETANAAVPSTPMIDFLRHEKPPFRVAPFFDYLQPNSSELVGVEDIRSHFGSEAAYRQLVKRLDPTSWSGRSTVILLNSLNFNFNDPLTRLLGIRWYIEHKPIDIVKWSTIASTVQEVKETGALELKPGQTVMRTVRVVAEPFWAIELPATIDRETARGGHLQMTLVKNGAAVWTRAFTQADTKVMNKVYIPLRQFARAGESVQLYVTAAGVAAHFLKGENANASEAPLYYARVQLPMVFDRELPDGRLFRNLGELPRFRAVSSLRKLNAEEFLAAKDVDFEREAVITDDPVMPPEVSATDARVTLTDYAPDEQRVTTEASGPFYLASSEKLTPELRVEIDGKKVSPIGTDLVFAGVPVPAGHHNVVFTRRIARGWWGAAAAGLFAWLLVAGAELWRAFRVRPSALRR